MDFSFSGPECNILLTQPGFLGTIEIFILLAVIIKDDG